MIGRILASAVFLIALKGPVLGAEIMDRVARTYEGLTSLAASFSQEVWQPRLGRIKRSAGKVSYLRPRKVRWEYTEGQEGLLIGDGVSWHWHEPSERQVVVTPYRPDSVWEELLFDPVAAAASMTVTEARREAGEWEVRLAPRNEGAIARSVMLFVDDRTATVVGASVEDAAGGRTGIRLRDIRMNAPMEEADFIFSPPPGTRIVEGK